MLNQPTSSPIITRMLGFFSCADRDGVATVPKTARNVASKTTAVPIRFMYVLHLFSRRFENPFESLLSWNFDLFGTGARCTSGVDYAVARSLCIVKSDKPAIQPRSHRPDRKSG